MNKEQVLQELDLGSSVAEHDKLLAQCFISHPILSELVEDRKDIVLGAKGAGKSSLWKELMANQGRYGRLGDVNFKLVTNPAGDPEFRDVLVAIGDDEFPSDDELRVGWRLYFLAQFWKACNTVVDESEEKNRIAEEISKYGIIARDVKGIKAGFAFAMAKARALRSLEVKWTDGISLQFEESALRAGGSAAAIPFNDMMTAIDGLLQKTGRRVWLILDRLDEIVLGNEARENSVLRGLLLAYRDVSDWQNFKVKIFLRDDVYDRVTSTAGFPALTHVKSKAAGPIRWENADLLHLLVRRLVENESVSALVEANAESIRFPKERNHVFYRLFPEKVDKGRAAETIDWIVDRIRDGNYVATPRDLISVVDAARVFQLEEFARAPSGTIDGPLFLEDSIRKAVRKISKENLETRIYAEYPDLRKVIEKFRGGKADHNEETLAKLLGDTWSDDLARLVRVGFMYRRNRSGIEMWTIPFFFSFGLEVTRGAAFEIAGSPSDEDEL